MTDFFSPWCEPPKSATIGKHNAQVLASTDDTAGINAVTAILPRTYAKKKNLKRVAQRHGKEGVAKLLGNKMPKTKGSRSGDMGEILGTAYVNTVLGYKTGPSRLVQRDHQEWALRGDDVLGARLNGNDIELVKVEAKSRVKTRESAITSAREGLQRNGDLASPHSLTQFAERLLKTDEALSDAINDLLQDSGVRPHQLKHLMFIFTQNDPAIHVLKDLNSYTGRVTQTAVTVRVGTHQDFIANCYDSAVAHAP